MTLVQPAALFGVWPKVRGWIQEAIKEGQGDEDIDDVLIALARGLYGLWYEPDRFAAVVQMVDFPRQKVMTVLYAGGNLESFVARWDDCKQVAQSVGASVVRVYGRPGWEKVLNMKRVGVILQSEVG